MEETTKVLTNTSHERMKQDIDILCSIKGIAENTRGRAGPARGKPALAKGNPAYGNEGHYQ
jgi:hypothetical protein